MADGITAIAEHPSIDATKIGLWGISQAGWVMPKAMEVTDDVAFMVVVGGGAEDGIEQTAYQVGQQVICNDGTPEQADLVDSYWSQQAKATSYDEYAEAMKYLVDVPELRYTYSLEITEEEKWKPKPPDIEAFFDPMDVIEKTNIPILVFYGELDKNIDPFQGAEAYETALQKAGNQDYSVEVIPGVGHVLMPVKTGCMSEPNTGGYSPQYLELMEEWIARQAHS